MCGILIHKKSFKPIYNLDHRGLYSGEMEYLDYTFHHRSLPLQTFSKDEKDYIQPIKVNDYTYLLFNGEIFNYRKFGVFNSDLNYLCHLFSHGYNDELLNEINRWDGFWSIVILDCYKNEITIFTDPLGKKQLYYSKNGISSEIKPLLETDDDYRIEYNENCFGTLVTPFFNIHRMLPGNIYKMVLGRELVPSLYKRNYMPLRVNTIKTNLVDMLDESVKLRTINKLDGVTLFVSGGLDSTIILYHLLERGVKPELLTIHNMTDPQYINVVEQFFKVKVKRIKSSLKYLKDATIAYEHPLDYGSLIPGYALCKESSNRVLLSGDGADELFGGYGRSKNSDTQDYDVFKELPYYHHIRMDRISMKFTKELRQPFLSTDIIKYALSLPRELRTDKLVLRGNYRGKIPQSIIDRRKEPLRHDGKKDNGVHDLFFNKNFFYESTRLPEILRDNSYQDAGTVTKKR